MATTRVLEEKVVAYSSGNLSNKTWIASDVAYRIDALIAATSRTCILHVVLPDEAATEYDVVLFNGESLTALQNYTDTFAVPARSTCSIRFGGSCTVGFVTVDSVPGSVI